MISVLIPVFNFDVNQLVRVLHSQCVKTGKPFEILCVDDASDEVFKKVNQSLASLEGVFYHELSSNAGRSGVRNKLADLARFDLFLFMDCDGLPVTDNYIQNYIDIADNDKVIYGGRLYEKDKPGDPALVFHWTYGTHREAVPAKIRSKKPFERFMTNNFVIPRHIYFMHPMNEEIKGYGHEDTLFAMELETAGIDIVHIENPMYHIGLENGEVFLKKQENAIRNLVYIIQHHKLAHRVKLYRFYNRLKMSGVMMALYPRLKKKENFYRQNLLGPNPSIRSLDWLKLIWLHESLK